jgi:hypothetical protein
VAGFLIGGSGSGSESEGGGELTSSASAGSLGLSFPGDWKRVTEEPKVPGMRFSQPIVLAPSSLPGARLIAGKVGGAGPTLLPRGFLSRLPRAPSREDTVKLGRLPAYRYSGLAPKGATERITVYAAPTTEGVVAVACVAAPRAVTEFGPACERVAATLELSAGKPLALGPREDYAREARSALGRLDEAAASSAGRLRNAGTPAAQASAAADLGDAYRDAARALAGAPVGPFERDANSRRVSSLRAPTPAPHRRLAAAGKEPTGPRAALCGAALQA